MGISHRRHVSFAWRPGAAPVGMPVLSTGRHRRPKRGACLMEYVSFLAGERFSDAPACTDPTLAAIARAVNDYSSDDARQRLAIMASDLTSAGPAELATQQAMARRCLLTAIPHASGERRRTLIVAVLGLERAAAGESRGFDERLMGLDTELALLDIGRDVDLARDTVAALAVQPSQHHKRGLNLAIEMAIQTIASESRTADDDLYRLLTSCLGDVAREHRAATRTRRSALH